MYTFQLFLNSLKLVIICPLASSTIPIQGWNLFLSLEMFLKKIFLLFPFLFPSSVEADITVIVFPISCNSSLKFLVKFLRFLSSVALASQNLICWSHTSFQFPKPHNQATFSPFLFPAFAFQHTIKGSTSCLHQWLQHKHIKRLSTKSNYCYWLHCRQLQFLLYLS